MKKSYFARENELAQEEYMNNEGFMEFEDESFEGQEELGAAGHAKASHKVSDPIIFSVANSVATDMTSVELMYVSNRLGTPSGLAGTNFTLSGVSYVGYPGPTFTSGIPLITYYQIINNMLGKAMTIGHTRMLSTSIVQIRSVFTVATYSMNGAFAGKPCIPQLDSYQYQSGQVDIYTPYMLNMNTSWLLATLSASTTLQVQFFPSATLSEMAELAGKKRVNMFSRPKVNAALNR